MNPLQKIAVTGALVGATIVGGAVDASMFGAAGAQTSSTAPTASSSTAATTLANMPRHGTAAHEDAEKTVTGDAATSAQAAAVKSVGSGTASAVTADFTGNGYETTVTKTDGNTVEVHLDSSFNVIAVHGQTNAGSTTG